MENLIPLFIIIPLCTAFLIPIIGRFVKGFSKVISTIALLSLFVLALYYLFTSNTVTLTNKVGHWEPFNNIPIAIYLVVDGLSSFLLCVIGLIGLLSVVYSISYIKIYTAENNFYALLCLMIAGLNGVVLSGDLFNIYVFLEVTVIASYALVAFGVEKEELEASFKYQVLGGIATALILFSIGMIYWYTKTLNMADIGDILKSKNDSNIIKFCQLVFIAGFGLKAAIMPFHGWLPDAHSSAPSPISSMLSGVVIKVAGLYVIFRLFFNMFLISYDIALVLAVIGTLSMIFGVFLAIGQWDLKRLLAYSSISQIGYIVLGISLGMMILTKGGDKSLAVLAIFGGLFHLINHAVFKGLLFLNAGAIEYRTGTRDLNQLGGLAEKMPVTSSTSLIASFSISGIPPFNGFFSKLFIIIAAIKAQYYLLGIIAIIASIITLAYFLKFQKSVFYGKRKSENSSIREVPFAMCLSMILLAVLCIGLSSLIIPGVREAVIEPAVNVLINATEYSVNVLSH